MGLASGWVWLHALRWVLLWKHWTDFPWLLINFSSHKKAFNSNLMQPLKETHLSKIWPISSIIIASDKAELISWPVANAGEKDLPRTTRSTLSQLRSGYSISLNSYKARLDPEVSDLCPDCNTDPHTADHLFNCTAKPTDLTVRALWDKPLDVATFLGLPHEEPYDDNG